MHDKNETGAIPSEWKQARVVPLFKSENKDELDNYRPISISPKLSRNSCDGLASESGIFDDFLSEKTN